MKNLRYFNKSLSESIFKEEYQNVDKRKERVEHVIAATLEMCSATKDKVAMVVNDINERLCEEFLKKKQDIRSLEKKSLLR